MSDQQSLASTSRPGSPVGQLPDFSSSQPFRFTWDPSTRRPGPASVSGTTTDGRGDYFAYRPSLGNLNFSTASLALGAIPSEWSSAKHGFNAISTLVNSPHKKSAPPKAHAAVPPVVPAQLPRVRRKDFDAYLNATASDWEQFERTTLLKVEGSSTVEGFGARLAKMNSDPPTTPKSPRVPTTSQLPPLESVPSVYFDVNFTLSEPRTFTAVIEQKEGQEGKLDPASLSHSLPLLEKMSHYADTIELHLIREISLRSSSFFAALTNLNELQTESAQCLERIRKLRGLLRDVDEKGAKKGLEVVGREKKLRNLAEVQEGVKTIQNVGEMFTVARNLVNGGEFEPALNVVDGLRNLWEAKVVQPPPRQDSKATLRPNAKPSKRNSMLSSVPESINEEGVESAEQPKRLPILLSSIKAFASLPDHLSSLTVDITKSLTSELVNVLKTDLLTVIDTAFSKESMDKSDSEHLASLKERLRPLVSGLRRTKGVREALLRWRDLSLVEIKLSIKRHLPSSEELDEGEANPPAKGGKEHGVALRNQLKAMPHSDFVALLKAVFTTMLTGIQELQTQNAILVDILQNLPTQGTAGDIISAQADLDDILSSATELAHLRASKVLSIRTEQHAALSLAEFLAVSIETWDFVIKSETICRKMVVGLRGVIVSQSKAFLQTMHQARIAQSAKHVEEEQWSAGEVSAASQTLATTIVESAMGDPPALRVLPIPSSMSIETNGAGSPPAAGSSKHLLIEDRKYFAVPATLQMLGLLVDYLKIITNLSLLTTETVGRVIEFLKAFNSRTCQVVLGAGAMKSAGLKNITAKHLALASQSLSIVIALIPYVRECFRRHLNPKQAVMLVEFDKLKRDYQEHQQEIHSKLIAIMGDRVNAHCKTLQGVDWSIQRDSVNDYMVLLVKETVTLHRVLSRYLQDTVLEFIISQVFASISHRLTEEFGKIELPNQDAKDRMLRDARYLHQNLSGLKNVNSPTGMLETVIGEKRVTALAVTQNEPVRSPTPSMSPQNTAVKPTTPQTHHTPLESTNERLRGLFRRSTMLVSTSESKEKVARPTTPPTPRAEKQAPITAEKPETRGIGRPVSPPPPPPEKLAKATISTPSPLISPPETNGRRSPLPVEKDLPIPVAGATSEAEANNDQPRLSEPISETQNTLSEEKEGKPVDESATPNGNGLHSEALPEVSAL